jgi:lysophospholipase L1-like esterase
VKILCYGDSNTWGYSPFGGLRFGPDTRWPAVMAECLGADYSVIEEGLNGRTIGAFAPPGNPLNGLDYLERVLRTHPPESLSLIILYLGINDLFQRDDIGTEEIARNIGYAVGLIRSRTSSPVLLIPPPPLNIPEELSGTYRLQVIKAESFYEEYRKIAESRGTGKECPVVEVLETGSLIHAGSEDGVHLEAAEHRKLGKYLCGVIPVMLSGGEQRAAPESGVE